MATYNKFQVFVENLFEGVHNLQGNTIKLYLTNNTPDAAADSIKTDLVGITEANGYTEATLANKTSSQTSGTYTFSADDVTWTASGGTVGPFRYVVMFNDTSTSPADPLIAWWDYGTSITLASGESFTADVTTSIITAV